MKSSCTKKISIILAKTTLILAFLIADFILFYFPASGRMSFYAFYLYVLHGWIDTGKVNKYSYKH